MSNAPRLPNTPITDGMDWSEDLANLAFMCPIYDDDNSLLGHRERIRDDELSNVSGAIKQRMAGLEGGLLVSKVSGLTIAVAAGSYRYPGGVATVAAQQLTVPDSAVSVVYIGSDGLVAVAPKAPVVRVLLARVTASGGAISTVEDLRYPGNSHLMPSSSSIKSFGGQSTTDIICTNGQVLDQGYYYCRNFTVPNGVTVTVDRYAKFICSGDFTVNGTLIVTQLAAGAPFQPYGLSALGSFGGLPGNGLGARGNGYPWGASKQGTGGSQGQLAAQATSWGYTAQGGDGGGCIEVEAAGKITVTGIVQAIGTSGGKGGTNPNCLPGATAVGNVALISGSGGGSGGLVNFASLTSITVATGATIDIRGGNGGDALVYGATGNTIAMGGSPGGGGWLVCSSPSVNTTGANLLIAGGTPGACAGSGTFANPSTGVYTVSSLNASIGASPGGGFGGNSGTYTSSGSGTITFTASNGGNGKVVYNSFIPVG